MDFPKRSKCTANRDAVAYQENGFPNSLAFAATKTIHGLSDVRRLEAAHAWIHDLRCGGSYEADMPHARSIRADSKLAESYVVYK